MCSWSRWAIRRRCCSSIAALDSAAEAAAAAGQQQKQEQQQKRLKGLRIGMTTPADYARRLAEALRKEGAEPVSCATIAVGRTPAMKHDLERVIWGVAADSSGLSSFGGAAFVSRSAIASFADALNGKPAPIAADAEAEAEADAEFLVGALGQDAELIRQLNLFGDGAAERPRRMRLVVPDVAAPEALVAALGDGGGKRLLCPVPHVLGLKEPPVVPAFLAGLQCRGWRPVRVNAYVTRWTGAAAVDRLLERPAAPLDALLLTSTAEVEGLLKSLAARGTSLADVAPRLLVAYGPVTASGAEQLGVRVHLVGSNFNSFVDLVDLLVAHFNK